MTTGTGNTKVDNVIDDFFVTLEGLLFPKTTEEGPEEGEGETENVDTKAPEDIDTDFLLSEVVRVLKSAESLASQYPNGSDALVAVADRYIRLMEFIGVYGE